MQNQYLRLNARTLIAFLISAVFFTACQRDQSVQEFSAQQDPAGTTLAGDNNISALAVTAPVTYNILPATSVPATPVNSGGQAVEIGVKFRVTQAGYITGIRFYKGATNTGTHIGHLWSSTGTKLAEATFTAETVSGWQQILFAAPVAVATGTTYVASYFSSSGFYAITKSYFTNSVANGPLLALADAEAGGNGVYKYSTTSAFPNSSFQSSNYWVDVVYSATVTSPPVTPPPTTPPATGIKYLSLPRATVQTYSNKTNLVIENLQFSSATGNDLTLNYCSNITIRNCYFGTSAGEGVSIFQGSNITIENCLFANNRTMVYVVQTTGNIKILNNQFVNCKGPLPRGQYVQFNTCTGTGNLIQGNRGECFEGRANPAEVISFFKSTGTAESPITVKDNIVRGGGPTTVSGGILAGDYGGKYILVENNKLVDPGQSGISVAGGTDITIRGNQIFAQKKPWNNVGMFVWAQAGATCSNITITNNRVNYTNKNGVVSNWWNGGGCSASTLSAPTTITLAEMNVPTHLISFITPAELLTIK